MDLEERFMAALIASERVERWLEAVRTFKRAGAGAGAAPLMRAKHAVRELVAALDSEVYVDEARQAGAVPLLTSLLKHTDDEDLLNDVSDALAACSGLMATSGKTRTFTYGGIPVVLKEGALGDGTGAKVWTSSHTLCREMAAHPDIVAGRRVLEIGSGCGGCGILAAKLGAAEVVLTDYSDAVLRNLRDCMYMNAAGSSAANGAGVAAANGHAAANGSAAAAAAEGEGEEGAAAAAAAAEERRQRLAEAEAWDPEDASECGSDDFDDLLGDALGGSSGSTAEAPGAAGQAAAAAEPSAAPWDVASPPMRVRYYDWQDSFSQLESEERAALLGAPGVPRTAAVAPGASIDTASNDSGAPGLGAEERFDVVIGTDIMYEWQMVLLVPSVIKHRLRPGGRALLCCAVREQVMFDAAVGALAALGLRAGLMQVQPAAADILDIKQEYEGGYVLVAVEKEDKRAQNWHRDDLFAR
ncbi:hypothetical protein ABPG75_009872 [Micractinium tetrahymenae]